MDEPQQPAAPRTPEDHEAGGGISRGKTIALWAGVAALLLALLGSLMIVLKSLQADRTLAQISKSAGSAVVQPSVPPPPMPLPLPGAPSQAAAPRNEVQAAPQPSSPSHSARAEKPRAAQARPVRRAEAPAQPKAVREPKMARASVERRLAQCKEYAGEAAAACFRKACSTYAKRAPICVNDEPTARR